MKKLFVFIIGLIIITSCSDDDLEYFSATIPNKNIVFVPADGGALMRYTIPNDQPDIYAIEAKYNDNFGNQNIIRGSYLSNEILLPGFIDAQDNIPVEISLIDKNGIHSEPFIMHFSTGKAIENSIFENMEVLTYWDGFKVKYTSDKASNGFIHVSIIDIDKYTQELDTLIIESETIMEGEQTLYFPNVYNEEDNTTNVVIWTQDKYGNEVKKKVFGKIPAAKAVLVNPQNFKFYGSSVEEPDIRIGWKYLFDGDSKGLQKLDGAPGHEYSFVSKKYAVPDENHWIIDMQEPHELGAVRIYCNLNIDKKPNSTFFSYYPEHISPSHVKIYATNNIDVENPDWESVEMKFMGEYSQPNTTSESQRWSYPMWNRDKRYLKRSELEEADPCYISTNFDIDGVEYRYVVIEIPSTYKGYNAWGWPVHTDGIVTFSEVEVYEKQ